MRLVVKRTSGEIMYKTMVFNYDSPTQLTEFLNKKHSEGYDLVSFSEFYFVFKKFV